MFDNYTKVEDYLTGRLSGQEKHLFEQAMEADLDLKKVVENHELYSLIADELINDDLSNMIKRNMLDTTSARKIHPLVWVMLLGLFAALSYLGINHFNKPDGPQLYATYYTPPMAQQVRGEGMDNQAQVLCTKAHQTLDTGDIEKAYQLFSQLKSEASPLCKEKSLFYLGLIELKNNDFDRASEFLKKILDGQETGYEQKAREILEKISVD